MSRWLRRLWAVVRADLAWTLGVVMGALATGFFVTIAIAGLDAAAILGRLMP